MPDFHLSQSEIFWHGALFSRLSPLADRPADDDLGDSDDVRECFPIVKDLEPEAIEPFAVIEKLAVEFGLAKYPSLEPASSEGMSPLTSLYEDLLPDDVSWTLADGTPVSREDFAKVVERLCETFSDLENIDDSVPPAIFLPDRMRHPESMLEIMAQGQFMVPRNLRAYCHTQRAAAMGTFVAEGHAWSQPATVYRVDWLGRFHRFQVPQQTNPMYAAILARFADEMGPSWLAGLSLLKEWLRSGVGRDRIDAIQQQARRPASRRLKRRGDTPRLSKWLRKLHEQHGGALEWTAANHLEKAARAASLLCRYIVEHREGLAATIRERAAIQNQPTLHRLAAFCNSACDLADEAVLELMTRNESLSEATANEMELVNARYLCFITRIALADAADAAAGLFLPEVVALAHSGRAISGRIEESLRANASDQTSLESIREDCRNLAEIAISAIKLAYGQLYFRELAHDAVYVDTATKDAILRQPLAVQAQLAEAIAQYERQTLPNCTVTSVCGLVEPAVRKMAAAWLPSGTYRGDTATVLKALLSFAIDNLDRIRASVSDDAEPSPEEADALLKLFCINVAFSLNNLGNTVRHHAHKVLNRHDAGVMLHGLCAILQRV